jgi:hypothetical protein
VITVKHLESNMSETDRNNTVQKILADHHHKIVNSTGKYYAGDPVKVLARDAVAALIAWKDAAVRTELTLFVSWYNNKYDTGYDSGIADERVAEFLSQLQAREEKR